MLDGDIQRPLALMNQRGRSYGPKSFQGHQAVGADSISPACSEIVFHRHRLRYHISPPEKLLHIYLGKTRALALPIAHRLQPRLPLHPGSICKPDEPFDRRGERQSL
jgi:hypothetical protein